jgi:hypothetical protein
VPGILKNVFQLLEKVAKLWFVLAGSRVSFKKGRREVNNAEGRLGMGLKGMLVDWCEKKKVAFTVGELILIDDVIASAFQNIDQFKIIVPVLRISVGKIFFDGQLKVRLKSGTGHGRESTDKYLFFTCFPRISAVMFALNCLSNIYEAFLSTS